MMTHYYDSLLFYILIKNVELLNRSILSTWSAENDGRWNFSSNESKMLTTNLMTIIDDTFKFSNRLKYIVLLYITDEYGHRQTES